MLNSESEKRSNERLKTLHRRKKKYERVLSNPIKHKEPDDWDDIRQERYKTLIENIPCAVYSAYPGKAGPTTFMSNKWKDWTGYSPEELYHDSEGWSRCIHPDDREHAVNTYIKACRDRMEYNLEYRIVHKDTKQVRYVKDQGRLSKDEKDDVISVDGIITDITELKKAKNELDKYKDRLEELVRKRTAELTSAYETLKVENKGRERAEQSLREIEREKTTVLENLSDLIVYRDSDMVTRWASKSMANWHGMSQEQIKGRVCYNARYGLDEPCKECHIIDAMKSGRRQELEKQLPGGRCWHVTVNPVFNDLGRAIGTIEVSQDITDRKKAREELEKSKDILEKTFSSLDSAVFILDAQKPPLIIDCNPAATIIFGYGKEEMLGRTTEFLHISREKLLEFQKALSRSIQEQGSLSLFEFKMQRKDGQIFPSEHSVRSLKDDKGRMIGWVSVIRDITERKQQDDLTAIQRDLAIKLSAATELEDGLSLCLEAAIGASEMDCGGIYLIDEGSGILVLAVHSGLSDEFINHVYQYDTDSDNSRLVMKSEPVYTEHTQLDMVLDQTEKREGLSAIAVIPILNDGRVIGCLNVASHMSKQIHARSRLALETIAAQIGSTVARLETEEALRKSEELARASLNATNDMVYLVDTSRNILAVNDVAARNLGKTPNELIGTNIFGYFPPDIAKSREEYGNKVISSGKHVRFQDEREGKFYDVSIYPTFDSQGGVDRLAVFVTDITERRKAEESLRKSERIFRTYFELGQVGMAVTSPDKEWIYVNDNLCGMLGYSKDELIQTTWTDLTHPDDLEADVSQFEQVLAGEIDSYSMDKRFICKDGRIVYVTLSVACVRREDGSVEHFITHFHNITDRKRAEDELKISDLRIRSLIEQTTDSVFCYEYVPPIPTDLPLEQQVRLLYDGVLVECNDVCAKSYGAQRAEEIIGCKLTELFGTETSSLDKLFRAMIEGGYRIINGEGIEKLKDGMERYYLNNGHGIIEDGELVRIWGTFRDITELKRSEQALRETTDLLETVFEHTHMLVAYLDPQFNFVRVNRAYAETDGHEPSFFVGRNHFDLYPNAENEAIFRKVVETGVLYFTQAKPFEYAGHPERGVTYWNWSLVPVKQQDGAVCGLILTLTDVTEQKRAEQALRESEERFRRIFEEGPIGIATSGADFRFTRANAAFCEMMGRTESELRGLTFRDITYPEDLSRDIEPIQRLLRGEIPIYQTEKRYVSKGTEIVWGYMTATVVKNGAGQFQCFLIMVEDITDRKRAEGALRESEEKFRSLAEQSPNMIFINKKGKVVYANKKCEEIMGYTREELYSPDFDFRTLITPESLDLINDSFTRHLKGQEVQPYDYTIISKDDRRIEAINASKLIQYEGQPAILSVVTDITERKRAEHALRESKERLKILFESAPDAIYLIDPEGRIVDGNKTALDLIGFAKDEVIGKSLGEMGLLSGEQLSRAGSNLKKVAAGKLSGRNEYVLKRKDGTHVAVEVRTFPVKIDGKMLTLGIARDITKHKQTEKELLEHQAKLKSLASQLSLTEERERHRLATDLHDQISQSLVISKIKLDQLRKSSISEEINKPLEGISLCLGQIIDDTRALTFDLSYPILYELGFEAAVAEWLIDQIQEKHRIETEFEDDGRQKPLDDDIRVLLFRNVRELLINVIKHAEANKVRVSIRRDNENINVVVEDDGVGFDPVEVTSMTAKRAEFGLFSIRERLEQLGGMIEIDSKPRCGSRITMRAPLKYNNSTGRIGK